MSTKPMRQLGKKQKATLDLSKADTLQCDDCGPGPCSEVWEDLPPIDISNFNVEII